MTRDELMEQVVKLAMKYRDEDGSCAEFVGTVMFVAAKLGSESTSEETLKAAMDKAIERAYEFSSKKSPPHCRSISPNSDCQNN